VKGLANLGNTCFFNAVLQILRQTQLLEAELRECNKKGQTVHLRTCCKSGTKSQAAAAAVSTAAGECHHSANEDELIIQLGESGPMSRVLLNVFDDMSYNSGLTTKQQTFVNPSSLFNQVCSRASRFKGFQQQDSHELLRYLLDALKAEEIKRSQIAILKAFNVTSDSSPHVKDLSEERKMKIKEFGRRVKQTYVDKVFGGVFISTIVCHTCNTPTQIFEPFLDISVPIIEDKTQSECVSSKREPHHHQQSSLSGGSGSSDVTAAAQDADNKPTKHQLKRQQKQARKNASRMPAERRKVTKADSNSSSAQNKSSDGSTSDCITTLEGENIAKQSDKVAVEELSTVTVTAADEDPDDETSTDAGHSERAKELVTGTVNPGDGDPADETVTQELTIGLVSPGDGYQNDTTAKLATGTMSEELAVGLVSPGDGDPVDGTVDLATGTVPAVMATGLVNPGDGCPTDETMKLANVMELVDMHRTCTTEEVADRTENVNEGKTCWATVTCDEAEHDEVVIEETSEDGSETVIRETEENESKVEIGEDTSETVIGETKENESEVEIGEDTSETVIGETKENESKVEIGEDTRKIVIGETEENESTVEISENTSETICDESFMDEQQKQAILAAMEVAGVRQKMASAVGDCSITSCLSQFTSVETLSGSNMLTCSNCNRTSSSNKSVSTNNSGKIQSCASKQLLIYAPPAVLTLHLKRFQQVGFSLRKLTHHVSFTELLDLSPYCTRLYQDVNRMKNSNSNSCSSVGTGRLTYSLYGVIEHSGTLRNGHYTAYVKLRQSSLEQTRHFIQSTLSDYLTVNDLVEAFQTLTLTDHQNRPDEVHEAATCHVPDGRWFHISDTSVSELKNIDSLLKCQAYLLFYERIQ
jgi:ubiquitin carboxyl-terminal hydrolase 16/45